ncbi:hypothetical protein Tco_0712129 [Tanacetum coccineum]
MCALFFKFQTSLLILVDTCTGRCFSFTADCDDPSYGEDEQTLSGLSLYPHPEARKKFKILNKRKVASDAPGRALPSKVQKVPARASKVVGELLLLWMLTSILISMKQHLREISIKQLCDIHDRAYMRQAVLDNVLNNRTRELIFALHKAKTSYDAIRA